jgi:hypothetical protein
MKFRGRCWPIVAAACAGAALAGCTETTVLNTRHTLKNQTFVGEVRTEVSGAAAARSSYLADLGATLRMDYDGATLPLPSPDGHFVAVQSSSDAPWNVLLGDALPASGLHVRIEAVSLDRATLGMPASTLEGAWLLGRAATNDAFLVERPRADGGRDIGLAPWNGGLVHEVVADGWTNAFATVTTGGSMAWCRRPAEGGDWQLVVERGGQRRVVQSNPGDQWLFPCFGGDGTGLFAQRLTTGGALVMAWLPFEPDGFPGVDAARQPAHAVPLALGATLQTAAHVMEPVSGLAASCPGSDRVTFYAPTQRRAATWTPGGRLEAFAPRSVSATMLDAEVVLVTTTEMLGRQKLGDPEEHVDMLADGPWVARPTTTAPTLVVLMRTMRGRVELAKLDVAATPVER